ncbi:MAG: hypothetical protein STSR0009_28590 [Methanoregula sp.]
MLQSRIGPMTFFSATVNERTSRNSKETENLRYSSRLPPLFGRDLIFTAAPRRNGEEHDPKGEEYRVEQCPPEPTKAREIHQFDPESQKQS